ncbi:hypothetical protein Cob_v009540 [Colletotrichum orbiculare MAFF 240422]|uniref:Uncharacterized protein n=1 Tax=Colletotrichum orbiculare (strain 104-T / ATCC 96160 / CBS 514.97 / LARS 414 / MAFF 240422) TaxID=1213857 RepID=A0A484FIS1_COLOR|nr:hypothetical protein Cob_v009540 [Colletotrichum orbiculare MAFF 240422]
MKLTLETVVMSRQRQGSRWPRLAAGGFRHENSPRTTSDGFGSTAGISSEMTLGFLQCSCAMRELPLAEFE